MSIWSHIRAVLLLPFMATVVVPALLVARTGARPGWGLPARVRFVPFVFGGALIALGLGLFAWTVTLFARVGKGTLAPWDPTERLVVAGPYRHVRNPMISGVFSVLLGEATLLGSPPVAAWALLFLGANQVYMPLVEERDMERRFGDEYWLYKRHVPRWVPRLRGWRPTHTAAPTTSP